MEIFLDSFDISGIEKYADYLVGITTNPSILSDCGTLADMEKRLHEVAAKFPNLLINLQVTASSAHEMVLEARKIAAYGDNYRDNFIVKVPSTFEGLKALKEIAKMGLKTNATLCFSLAQAQMAEDFGATYISPFLGRMQDAGENIEEFIYNMRNVVVGSKILAASLRSPEHVGLAISAQCDAITISEQVFDSLFELPLLKTGQELFAKANKLSYL